MGLERNDRRSNDGGTPPTPTPPVLIYIIIHPSSFFPSSLLSTNYQIYPQYELDRYTGPIQPPAPLFGGMMTGATYYMRAGPRVATLAGAIGTCAVGGTFAVYSVLGIPYGSKGWLFF